MKLPSDETQKTPLVLELCKFVTLGDSRKYPYHTTDGFMDFRRGGGVHDYGILREWGGIYDWKSEGMG